MGWETTVFKLFLDSLLKQFPGMGPLIQEMVIPYKILRLLFHPGYHPSLPWNVYVVSMQPFEFIN
jgi:hypothetical protein